MLREFGDVATIRRGGLVPRVTSVGHSVGKVAVNGFLLGMPQLLEDFVTVALREALETRVGSD